MDLLSTQQRKEALEDSIFRAVKRFEKETGRVITQISISHLDDCCTSVSVKTDNRMEDLK